MQNKLLPVICAAAVFTAGLHAQDSTTIPSAPPTPQPVTQAAVANSATTQAPSPSQVIFAPRLPTAAELTQVAGAQGLTVEQISQTASQITLVTRNANGQLNSVAYQLLPTNPVAVAQQPVVVAAAPSTVVVPAPATTVIYEQSPRVIYYDRYDYDYWPRYYYPPVSLSLGFGYYRGFGGGHYHGGYRGGYRHFGGGYGHGHGRR